MDKRQKIYAGLATLTLVSVSVILVSGKTILGLRPGLSGMAAVYRIDNSATSDTGAIKQSDILAQKSFRLKFDTLPKKADYRVVFSDGTEKTAKAPFDTTGVGGATKISLTAGGYNQLQTEILLDSDKESFYYLDKTGQLVHHLRNIGSVPSPKGIDFSPDGKTLWVTMLLNKKRGLSVYDVASGSDLADIDLNGGGGVELVFSKDGSRVYASQMETAKVYEIDTSSKKILRVFDTQSAWTKVVELSPDSKTLYAANWSGNDVSAIDLATGSVRRFPTVKTPRGLYPTADGKTLYVAGYGNGDIEKIDLASGRGKIIFSTGSSGAMRHIVGDESRGILFVSDMGKSAIFKVNLADDSVTKFVDTDADPNTIALSPDKKVLFVSCRGKNAANGNYYIPGPEWGSVLLFDTTSGKMLDAIVGGNQPTALAVSRDGSLLGFSDFLDSRIEIYRVPGYDVLQSGNGGRSSIYRSELRK